MARQVERSGATVDEAVEAALAELGVGREGAKIEVLDEATDDGEARVLVRAVEAAPGQDGYRRHRRAQPTG
jgi:spoIIIJ-associated protein